MGSVHLMPHVGDSRPAFEWDAEIMFHTESKFTCEIIDKIHELLMEMADRGISDEHPPDLRAYLVREYAIHCLSICVKEIRQTTNVP